MVSLARVMPRTMADKMVTGVEAIGRKVRQSIVNRLPARLLHKVDLGNGIRGMGMLGMVQEGNIFAGGLSPATGQDLLDRNTAENAFNAYSHLRAKESLLRNIGIFLGSTFVNGAILSGFGMFVEENYLVKAGMVMFVPSGVLLMIALIASPWTKGVNAAAENFARETSSIDQKTVVNFLIERATSKKKAARNDVTSLLATLINHESQDMALAGASLKVALDKALAPQFEE